MNFKCILIIILAFVGSFRPSCAQVLGGSIATDPTVTPKRRTHTLTTTANPGLSGFRSTDTLTNIVISVVGGGGQGGGGNGTSQGGGGGGGAVSNNAVSGSWIGAQTNSVTIGAGGSNGANGATGQAGVGSSFVNGGTTWSANGGQPGIFTSGNGANGGASGNGNAGGSGATNNGGGGGGSGGVGGAATASTSGGNGGNGSTLTANVSTLATKYGGGGGGAGTTAVGSGTDGGGAGGTANGVAGVVNTGGGGGGSTNGNRPGGNGGSGVVVVSYDAYDVYTAVAGTYNINGYVGGLGQYNGVKKVFTTSGTVTMNTTVSFGTDIVVIESGNNLTIAGGGTLTCGSIWINSGATLTLSGGTVNCGPITNNGTLTRTTGTINATYATSGYTIPATTFGNLTINANITSTAVSSFTVAGLLTIENGGILNMGNNTLSVTTTLSNSGKIITTCPTATSATPLTLPAGTWGGTIEYASTNAQTVIGGTYTNLTLSGSGTKSTTSTINVGKVYTSESGKLQINSSGSLNITGTLSSNEIHSVGASIELNGGDFIVSGIKNKDQTYSATAGTTPYMIIKSDIVDVLASGFRSNSIQFIPSNTSTEVSHIRFVGSGLDLGNSSSFNSTVKTNSAAYFEIGNGTTSTDLTLMDTLRLFNGLRTRVNSSLVTGGMLILNSDKNSIPGKGQSGNASNGVPIGYLDTCVASTITGNVKLTLTFSARRKIRFLGNPFSANLSITDFTDDIDITGDRSGTNNNNFTATASNAPSAYTYSNSADAWVAITNTTPTVLNSLQGMRILVRGVKGYGLDANNGSPVESRLMISGNPILGDQTINLLEGYNFITNPFLSIVDIGKVTKSTNVADVIYMYAPASSGYQTFNRNTKDISPGGSACWSPGTSIFFYASASATIESIGVPEGAKVSPTKQSYNSHFGELDTLNNIGNVVVKNILERQSLTDGITLDFSGSRNATDDFEPLFDGVDLGSDSVNVSVVSSNGKFLSYQATNPLAGQEVRRYPLKVEIRNSSLNGAYILMFDQFKAFTSDLSVLLVDKWLNTTTDLIAKPEYAFQISNDINSQGSGRFEIVVSNKSTVDVQDIIKGSASDFFVFNSPLDECVTFTAIGNGSNKSLRVLDLQGKLIKEYKDFQSPITLSSNEISRGIYIATVVSGQNKSTKKFIF